MRERRHQADDVSQIYSFPKRGEGKCKSLLLKLDPFFATTTNNSQVKDFVTLHEESHICSSYMYRLCS